MVSILTSRFIFQKLWMKTYDFCPILTCFAEIGQKPYVFIHNFWTIYTGVKIDTIFGIYRSFPFIWDPIWLSSDKIERILYIAGCSKSLISAYFKHILSILLQGNHKESTKTTMIFGFSSPKIGNLGTPQRPSGILHHATDWIIRADFDDNPTILSTMAATTLRPDLVIF